MKSLFKLTGFSSYILIIFLNAFTDLGHKLILQNTILKSMSGSELIALTAIINGLILLPYIFLFTPSGYISDKYPKQKVIEYAALAAIVITTLILGSYYMGWFWVAFGLTFILAVQSAIYSPAKYGLIKEMTGNGKLVEANAVVQAVTITSILLGVLIFSMIFEYLLAGISPEKLLQKGEILIYIAPIGLVLIIGSVIEYILAKRLVRRFNQHSIDTAISFNFKNYRKLEYLKANFLLLKDNNAVWLSILGLSVLWGVVQVVLAISAEYFKSKFEINNTIVSQGLLALSGLGMVIGAISAGRISKNYIETGIIPLGALGGALFLYMIPYLETQWSLGMTLFLFGFSSGFFLVPLMAIIQFSTPTKNLGKVLAGSNFIQNISMLLFLILTIIFGAFELDTKNLFYIISVIAFVGMGYTFIKLPQSLIRYLVRMLIGFKYDLSVYGLENVKSNSQGILLLGNHVSLLDWAILQMAYPEQIRFVMGREYYERWYLKPFLEFFNVIPISSKESKDALKQVTQALKDGETVALFPEGHLSRTGHLGVFKRGFELATKEVDNAVIIPFYLRGLWSDDFSYASKKVKRAKSKDISVCYGKAIDIHSGAEDVKKAVFETSITSWSAYAKSLPSLQKAWLKAGKEVGSKFCMADSTGKEVTGHQFITGTFLIARGIKKRLKANQNIGILLPSVVGGVMGNMAILSLGKTIVNLNYSSGEKSLLQALKIADIRTILTSKLFLSKLKSKGFDMTEVLKDTEIIYLEEERKNMGKIVSLVYYLMVKILPTMWLSFLFIKDRKSHDTAAILFSSGSEGAPKGIELSHQNIIGNIKQSVTVLNAKDSDVLLGVLPLFHSFGLTVTTLLPLIESIPLVCHPDPTDSEAIGKLAAKYKTTIFGTTATFLRIYTRNKKLTPLMFEHLRFVVGGAERIPQEIRDGFKKKFGLDIYEGYGATETTPAATMNFPDVLMLDSWKTQIGNKEGTVGLPIPGSSVKIVDPISYEILKTGEDGMILIGGTQIMKGYIGDKKKTESVIIELDGIEWYITGDKGHLDEDGFLTVVDRYSRFAKVGGEMISLGLVEAEISKFIGAEDEIAISALPDIKKGEKLVLLLEGEMSVERLKEGVKALALNPLFLPSQYFKVEKIPKLGTGKSDFKASKKLAVKLSTDIS